MMTITAGVFSILVGWNALIVAEVREAAGKDGGLFKFVAAVFFLLGAISSLLGS